MHIQSKGEYTPHMTHSYRMKRSLQYIRLQFAHHLDLPTHHGKATDNVVEEVMFTRI
jgi:hypothetical protein